MATDINLEELIAQHTNAVIVENSKEISALVAQGITPAMTDADVLARVSLNAVNAATRLSVRATLAVLTDLGIIPQAADTSPKLHVLSGGAVETNE